MSDYHIVMNAIGIAELKARLSEHIRAVRVGKSLIVLDRRTPVAKLVPYEDPNEGIHVEEAKGPLQELPVPPPAPLGFDIVDELMDERQERL